MYKFIILGCGYLGTNFANYIVNNSDSQVYVLGIENEYNNYLDNRITFISKTIEQINNEDFELFKDAIVIDAVGNINATHDSMNSKTVFLDNCAGKVNLVYQLNSLQIKKYIFLSSGGTVYNDSENAHVETDGVNPKSIYALEKIIIEDYLSIFGSENDSFSYLILRLSNPYGGVISSTKKQGIIDVAISKIRNNEPMEFYGELSNVRDYIHVDDVAYYLYHLSISDRKNDIYNVGSGEGVSIEELFNIIEEVAGKRIELVNNSINTVNIKTNILNIEKLKSVVKNENVISIKEGIERYFK